MLVFITVQLLHAYGLIKKCNDMLAQRGIKLKIIGSNVYE